MSTRSGVDPLDTFYANAVSRGAVPRGKNGNTHVVPPKCQLAQLPISKFEPRPPR
jgi:hypothetical protein